MAFYYENFYVKWQSGHSDWKILWGNCIENYYKIIFGPNIGKRACRTGNRYAFQLANMKAIEGDTPILTMLQLFETIFVVQFVVCNKLRLGNYLLIAAKSLSKEHSVQVSDQEVLRMPYLQTNYGIKKLVDS